MGWSQLGEKSEARVTSARLRSRDSLLTRAHCVMQEAENGGCPVDKTTPGAAAVSQKGKWDYLIGVGLACFIGLLNGSLSGTLAIPSLLDSLS